MAEIYKYFRFEKSFHRNHEFTIKVSLSRDLNSGMIRSKTQLSLKVLQFKVVKLSLSNKSNGIGMLCDIILLMQRYLECHMVFHSSNQYGLNRRAKS